MQRRHLLTLATAGLAGSRTFATPPRPPTREPAASASWQDLSSLQLSRRMGAGWNLGNALEATGGETGWGNARTTQRLIDAVKAAGFSTLRLPVAWKQYADARDTISPAWLARVAEVVGYARQAGLFTLLNTHWDGGWLQPTYASQAACNARLASYWTQIATHFRAHGEHLLFAGTNEVMVEGDYGPPTAEYVAMQNGYNQVFVDAVRATGGPNLKRHLVVQGFNTNIDHTVAHAVLPRDPTPQRLMMEVHYYDPYRYTIDEKSPLWQWGAGTTDPSAADTWGNEAHADAQFAKMKAHFVDRGVPVILGEFGVLRRAQPGAEAFRIAWNRHVAQSAWRHGAVPVVWDNGVTGLNGMGLFHRADGRQAYPDLIRALVEAVR